MAAADAAVLSASIAERGDCDVVVDGEPISLTVDEIVFTETPREGWAVQHDSGESIALDLEITPDLRRLGIARDVIRLVQEARKNAGLDVSDRITLAWQASGEVAEALLEHQELVSSEVLATTVLAAAADLPAEGHSHQDEAIGREFRGPEGVRRPQVTTRAVTAFTRTA